MNDNKEDHAIDGETNLTSDPQNGLQSTPSLWRRRKKKSHFLKQNDHSYTNNVQTWFV